MGKIAFIFPGQGAQYVGMGKDFYDKFDSFKKIIDRVNEILDIPLKEKILNGPTEQLTLTENTQPAVLSVSYAVYATLEEEGLLNIEPDFVLGHSLGEYTALVVSESLKYEDALPLVRDRGKFMQEAVPADVGAMAAIMGLAPSRVEALCWEEGGEDKIVVPANYNSPNQIVVAGVKEAVERVVGRAKDEGAKRVVYLDVSAPFHTPLMKAAAEKLKERLEETEFSDLKYPLLANVDARIHTDKNDVPNLLYFQIFSPVRWQQSIELLKNEGVTHFLEIGPGRTLVGLIRSIYPEAKLYNVAKTTQLKGVKEFLDSVEKDA